MSSSRSAFSAIISRGAFSTSRAVRRPMFFTAVDDPLVYFVREFVEINVVDGLFAFDFAEDVDGIAGEHGGELDILAAFTDGEAHLVGIEEASAFLSSSLISMLLMCAGLRARWMNNIVLEE